MNLLGLLHDRISQLPNGDHTLGLNAVVRHIEVAQAHLERAQQGNDLSGFTDAIYRTNQAFEGSLKEAYRVLARKDPSRITPHKIEQYLATHNVLRPRVVTQLGAYRDDWRNPSTHDYKLDFDEAEALLAIITVSGFAIVLIDQILERLSFEKAQHVASAAAIVVDPNASLLETVVTSIERFADQMLNEQSDDRTFTEAETVGSLAGFLTATFPKMRVQSRVEADSKTRYQVDVLVAMKNDSVLIEVKSGLKFSESNLQAVIAQVTEVMANSGIDQSIILLNFLNRREIRRRTIEVGSGRIEVVYT